MDPVHRPFRLLLSDTCFHREERVLSANLRKANFFNFFLKGGRRRVVIPVIRRLLLL